MTWMTDTKEDHRMKTPVLSAAPGQLILKPENSAYPPQVYTGPQLEDVAIEGKVVGIFRDMEGR